MEGKVERVSREFAQQEEQVRAQALALDASKAKLASAEQVYIHTRLYFSCFFFFEGLQHVCLR
jgi:hypothetical protein